MNIFHVNLSDLSGGAGRAGFRIHRACQQHSGEYGIYSRMRVFNKESDDHDVISGAPQSRPGLLGRFMRRRQVRAAWRGFVQPEFIHHSIAYPDSALGSELRSWQATDPANIVHLHWVGEAPFRGDVLLSIEEIGRLTGPLVWTLHDQWAFCGAEHYVPSSDNLSSQRFVLGYTSASRDPTETCRDLNRETWLRKQSSWRQPMQIVCPSRWMADCVRSSALMAHWPISVVPNPIDPDQWAPIHVCQARELLRLPTDRPLVLFGSIGGTSDPRKGGDLLLLAMQLLRRSVAGTPLESVELVIFGQSRPAVPQELGFPVHYLGRLQDDLCLRLAYSAADVFVIPSRQDNLPNTGLEAHACGAPVVAFETGGLVDIVEPGITGALAKPFDPASLAASILWVLEDSERLNRLRSEARKRAVHLWHPRRISGLYADIYQEALSRAWMSPSS